MLVNGDTSFEPTESFFVNVTTVAGTGVTVADGQGEGTIQNDDIDCAAAFTPISEIQGAGAATPIPGTVTTKGVVVGDYESSGPLRGFYLQDAPATRIRAPRTASSSSTAATTASPSETSST